MAFGSNRTVNTKHKFLVQSQMGFASFQKCSPLEFETAKIEYFEGGALIPIKAPGRVTFSDITLERGTSGDYDFYDWALQVNNAALNGPPDGMVGGRSESGMTGTNALSWKSDSMQIQQYDVDNALLMQWNVVGAWPQKFVAGDWDNSVDEVVIEQLILTYDYYYRAQGFGSRVA
jgi:phage tail-like protein